VGLPRYFRRNREIVQAVQAGECRTTVAERHGITVKRLVEIVIAERHRMAVSPYPEYQNLRRSGGDKSLQKNNEPVVLSMRSNDTL